MKLDYNLRNGSTLMVRWSRDDSDTIISQNHPLFNEQVGTQTRYFTSQYQSICHAEAPEHAPVCR